MTQKKLEKLIIICEEVMQTMKYDARTEARTRIEDTLLDNKEDLSYIEVRHHTLQKWVMELQKKIRWNNLILTKVDKGNTMQWW